MKNCTIALTGNPNVGKTTLFNQLTGAQQRVGNWAGVTVERKEGIFNTTEHQVRLVDLPGTYSLTTLSAQASLDEQIACHYLLSGEADLVINVVDASNLLRNLYLTVQLLEMGQPCIIALNMLDIAERQHISVNCDALAQALGCPVIPLVSTRGKGLDKLKQAIDSHPCAAPDFTTSYPASLQDAIDQLITAQPASLPWQRKHWLALQMLEGDIWSQQQATGDTTARLHQLQQRDEDFAQHIVSSRYRAIRILCQPVIHQQPTGITFSQRLDRLVMHRWLGLPIFFLVMYLMFFLAINLGGALQPLFEMGSAAIFIQGTQWLGATLHFPLWLTLFLAQGIGGGINTVMPLVPQIGMMFLFLSFLEDSGYMARAAFVMDRLMQALGLPGKSFVPLIVGFGCNVPSVMAARTLDAPRERLLTILMAPFISCGARLAIFAVFTAAFFGQHGSLIVFSLYLLGIVMAVLTGLTLRHTLMRGSASPFVMELPVWHVPHLKSLLLQSWQRLRGFVLRAGKVIVLVSMLIGALNSFSLNGEPVSDLNQSALASVSRTLTPLLAPVGVTEDNWQATVGLLTGAMAKEVVVGTLNTLYTAEAIQQQPFDADNFNLSDQLLAAWQETWQGIKDVFSLSVLSNPVGASMGDADMAGGAMGTMHSKFVSDAAAYSYLIFVLLYVPCVSVMGAIARESSYRWMLFSILWGLDLAYSLSALFYQLASFQQHPGSSSLILTCIILINALIILWLRRMKLDTAQIPVKLLPTDEQTHGCRGCNQRKNCHH